MFRTTRLLLALACTLAIPFVVARGQDSSTSKPSTRPVGEVIDVKDFAKLKEMIGTDVTVRGKVSEVFVPRSASVTIFNFEGIGRRDFNVVVRKENLDAVNAGFDGDVGAAVKGKTITVSGKVAEYRGNPQLQLEKPEQLRIEKPEDEKKE